MKLLRSILPLAALGVLALTASAQYVTGPSTNLGTPNQAPLKGDVIAARDYTTTGPDSTGYIYAETNSSRASSTLTAATGASNTAKTITLTGITGKSWVITGIQTTLAGGTPGTLAASTTTLTGSASVAPSDGDTETIQGKVYTFKTTLAVSATEGQVLIGTTGSTDAAYTNLASALNGTSGGGTTYWSAAANPYVSSAAMASHNLVISARIPGSQGNTITTVAAGTAPGSFTGATMASGAGAALQIQDGTITVAGATVPNYVFSNGFGVTAGTEKISFNPPLKATSANTVTVSLSAGGSSVFGLLNVEAFLQ